MLAVPQRKMHNSPCPILPDLTLRQCASGWQVRTADVAFAGTDSDIYASWRCGSTAVTTAQHFLDCGVSRGEVLSGDLDDINCFER